MYSASPSPQKPTISKTLVARADGRSRRMRFYAVPNAPRQWRSALHDVRPIDLAREAVAVLRGELRAELARGGHAFDRARNQPQPIAALALVFHRHGTQAHQQRAVIVFDRKPARLQR